MGHDSVRQSPSHLVNDQTETSPYTSIPDCADVNIRQTAVVLDKIVSLK